MTIRIFTAAIAMLILGAGCKEEAKFKKTKGGLEYAIFKSQSGQKVNYGDVIKFRAIGYYADSILATPYDTLYQLADIDSMRLPTDLVEILLESKVGDSIITRLLTDSAEKFGPLPPYAKKGNYLGFRVKVLGVITDSAEASREKAKQGAAMQRIDSVARVTQITQDDKILTDYIAKQNAKAVKTAKGVYVEIIEPGTGPSIDSGKTVTVDYKGSTLDGKVFDQSYGATGASEKPFTFTIGQRGAIDGWDDGLRLFKQGGKGRLFIPSGMAYGPRGSMPSIKPNECLVFEVDVKKVMTPAEAQAEMERQSKAMQQQQKAE